MSDAEPARPIPVRKTGSDLWLRVGSASVLAPLAIGAAYLGGWWFAAFWTCAALAVTAEWMTLVAASTGKTVLAIGLVAVVSALTWFVIGADVSTSVRDLRFIGVMAMLGGGMVVGAITARREHPGWVAAGIPYAAAIGFAPIILRSDAGYGFVAIIMLFAAVWATDIAAYFIGRAIGGPKLAPRLSPNKTWSGAIGGLVGAVAAAVAVVHISGIGSVIATMIIAAGLSMVAQAGDLFESAIKRRFGAKDAGSLIPGHGGVMDRLDGFVAAAVLACLIGLAHGGPEAPARGLLVW